MHGGGVRRVARQQACQVFEDSRCQALVVVVRLLAVLEGLAVFLCAVARWICSSIKGTEPLQYKFSQQLRVYHLSG